MKGTSALPFVSLTPTTSTPSAPVYFIVHLVRAVVVVVGAVVEVVGLGDGLAALRKRVKTSLISAIVTSFKFSANLMIDSLTFITSAIKATTLIPAGVLAEAVLLQLVATEAVAAEIRHVDYKYIGGLKLIDGMMVKALELPGPKILSVMLITS